MLTFQRQKIRQWPSQPSVGIDSCSNPHKKFKSRLQIHYNDPFIDNKQKLLKCVHLIAELFTFGYHDVPPDYYDDTTRQKRCLARGTVN